jgi:hypothetical protein
MLGSPLLYGLVDYFFIFIYFTVTESSIVIGKVIWMISQPFSYFVPEKPPVAEAPLYTKTNN